MKTKLAFFFASLVLLFGFAFWGCGQLLSTSSTSSYTISGRYTTSASALSALAAPTVTSIVAISSDGTKSLASLSNGTFSLSVNKGQPCLIGFFNGTTLVGHLKQKEVDWDSLPLMNPVGSSTDLGTVEVISGTLEAAPSIALNDLIAKMNLDLSGATYYGKIDNPMTVLSNLDVDGNGTFDFNESKTYLFWADYSFTRPAQMNNMLGQYCDGYVPTIESYAFSLIFQNGSAAVEGAAATLSAPGNLAGTTITGTCDAQGNVWVFGLGNITTEATAPSGTYTAEVGSSVGTLTFNNFQQSSVSSIGASSNIVYPVLKITTNESGIITRVDYKWKIIKSGTATDAATAEISNSVEDTDKSKPNGFIHGSPFFEFFSNLTGTAGTGPIKIDRDAGFINLTSYNLKFDDVPLMSLVYNLSTRAVYRFRFAK